MNIDIVDTHVHMWDLNKATYAWLENDTSILNRSYDLEELLPSLSHAGVQSGVLVQAANNIEDTNLMLNAAHQHQWIKGVVGWLPLDNNKLTERYLNDFVSTNSCYKGVRHLIHNEPDPKWLLRPNVLNNLKLLPAHNLTYDIVGVNFQHLRTAINVAEKLSDLKLVLDHLNQPPTDSVDFEQWKSLMSTLAEFPNVYCKISGLGTAIGKSTWGKNDLVPAISFVLEHFGVNRCFCGGDWPVSLLAGPYEKAWLLYREIFSEMLSAENQKRVLHDNACEFYNL
ncbi:amidohydrolase family protein [Olivibacter sp. SDN3]|uniref:amidohydrolase family protein n=1 Tax=Olivibacter sp. SDN3 TaxID=2764720 RepID=UPI0016513105|nr:amidohydrolase family protein [Olivibacter sp. SDN3]QNL49567.1 amidohydrolase family protein [Olivibacter sp. SDN3]